MPSKAEVILWCESLDDVEEMEFLNERYTARRGGL
jgi:hypothetical protein